MFDSMRRPSCRLRVPVVALALCFGVASTTWAAEIEEIVVTAEKRESSLQETPIAVSAVSRETIEIRGIDDFQQVQFVVPRAHVQRTRRHGDHDHGAASASTSRR